MRSILAALIFLFVLGSYSPAASGQSEDAKAAILEQLTTYVDAYNRGDVDAVVDHWADDAEYLLATGERVQGRDALRKVFETTPMGSFSSSPGSIYPALKNMQKAGVIESRPAGKKSIFAITPAGEVAFEAWLRRPAGRR